MHLLLLEELMASISDYIVIVFIHLDKQNAKNPIYLMVKHLKLFLSWERGSNRPEKT